MRGLAEGERVTSQKYITQWIKNSTGWGLGERMIKESGDSLAAPLGLCQLACPSMSQILETNKKVDFSEGPHYKELLKGSTAVLWDGMTILAALVLIKYGNPWGAAFLKLGCNAVSQVAPDLVKLAADKTFQLKEIRLTP
ncbi:MAG: hypothetical protein HW400_310 [Candidatus Levybacteria bacterium]|nr:hypothetical protein [Candidatus Levybacteria bacterium]